MRNAGEGLQDFPRTETYKFEKLRRVSDEMVTRRVSEEREAIIARPRLRFGLPSCPRRSSADEPFY